MSAMVAIAAGGTGGHVFPALAVAESLRAQGHGVIWFGTRAGLEARVVPAAGIPMAWMTVTGLRGKNAATLLAAPWRLARSLWQAMRALRQHKPAALLGMGGFVAGPVGLAAWLLRIPVVIHEQNAHAGLTNRLLARVARTVLEAFPGTFGTGKAAAVGNPVRAAFNAILPPAARFSGRSDAPLRLLVVGGSLGAKALNTLVPQALALMDSAARPVVRHQGGRTMDVAEAAYAGIELELTLTPFIDDMAEAYAWADLAVCRAGALTVAELAAAGVPALLVPFPYAVDDHQTANAQVLVEAGAAELIQERDLTAERLAARLAALLSNRDTLTRMAEAARGQARPESCATITTAVLHAGGLS